MAPSSKPPKFKGHVFKSASADVILRSSDNIDFRVHKAVMSDASSVFETMFTLPQDPAAPEPADGAPALPVVPVQDSADTLNLVLGVLYPGKGPALSTPHRIGDVLAVADKYAMDGVTRQMRHLLDAQGFLDGAPLWGLAVYALARRHNFTKLAAKAARASLKHYLPVYTLTGLNAMTAAHYYDLVRYRETCVALFDAYAPDDDDDEGEDDDDWQGTIEGVWGDEDDEDRFKSNRRDVPDIVILNLCDCSCRGRLWFRLHLHRLKDAFAKSVCGTSLQDPILLDKTVASIGDCSSCLGNAPMEIVEFNKRLGDRLDRDLDNASAGPLFTMRLADSISQVDFWHCVLR